MTVVFGTRFARYSHERNLLPTKICQLRYKNRYIPLMSLSTQDSRRKFYKSSPYLPSFLFIILPQLYHISHLPWSKAYLVILSCIFSSNIFSLVAPCIL